MQFVDYFSDEACHTHTHSVSAAPMVHVPHCGSDDDDDDDDVTGCVIPRPLTYDKQNAHSIY